MNPGIYDDITNHDYHSGAGVSKSMLDVLAAKSPMHLQFLRSAANDNEPTAAQALGTAFHSLLLEPELFDETHVLPFVVPEGALVTSDDIKAVLKDAGEKVSGTKPELIERLKAIRPDALIADELRQQYAITNAGRTILQPDTWGQLRAMREAVHAHPVARALITAPGRAERSVYWIDAITGELCRCRPDYWRDDGIVVDVKTTDDASLEGFAKSIANWRYHVQHPYYCDGIQAATGQAPKGFVFLVVEKKPPHAVAVYALDSLSIELGRNEYRRDLSLYAECRRTGNWPGYGDRIQEIGLPMWKLSQAAREVAA